MSSGTRTQRCTRGRTATQGIANARGRRSHLLGAVAEEHGAGAQRAGGALQQRLHLRRVRLPQTPALVLHPPAWHTLNRFSRWQSRCSEVRLRISGWTTQLKGTAPPASRHPQWLPTHIVADPHACRYRASWGMHLLQHVGATKNREARRRSRKESTSPQTLKPPAEPCPAC